VGHGTPTARGSHLCSHPHRCERSLFINKNLL